jgi:hypothetical protein
MACRSEADSSALLRNDNQKGRQLQRQRQLQLQLQLQQQQQQQQHCHSDVLGTSINDVMTRTRIVLLVLVLTSSGLAALTMASTALALDSPLTREQYMQMCTAINALSLSFWLFQILIVWLILRGLWAYRSLLQIPISFLGSVLCSLGGGLLLVFIAQDKWFALARHFE